MTDLITQIIETLQEHGPLRWNGLRDYIDASEDDLEGTLKELQMDGKIRFNPHRGYVIVDATCPVCDSAIEMDQGKIVKTEDAENREQLATQRFHDRCHGVVLGGLS